MLRALSAVGLLFCSNIFMTTAWYWHLKAQHAPGPGVSVFAPRVMLPVILISWLIALPEYILQVPANRVGHVNFGGPLSAPQLKVIQEAITLVVFIAFATLYLKERIRVQDFIAFGLILGAVVVSMSGRATPLVKP